VLETGRCFTTSLLSQNRRLRKIHAFSECGMGGEELNRIGAARKRPPGLGRGCVLQRSHGRSRYWMVLQPAWPQPN